MKQNYDPDFLDFHQKWTCCVMNSTLNSTLKPRERIIREKLWKLIGKSMVWVSSQRKLKWGDEPLTSRCFLVEREFQHFKTFFFNVFFSYHNNSEVAKTKKNAWKQNELVIILMKYEIRNSVMKQTDSKFDTIYFCVQKACAWCTLLFNCSWSNTF